MSPWYSTCEETNSLFSVNFKNLAVSRPQFLERQVMMGTRDGLHECGKITHSEQYPCSKAIAGHHDLETNHVVPSCRASSRRSAIGLNQEAVTLLKYGNEGKALEIFKCALRLVKTDLTTGSSSPQAAQSWVIRHNQQEQGAMLDAHQQQHQEPPLPPICSGPDLTVRLQSCRSRHKHLRLVQLPISKTLSINESLFLYSKAFTFQFSKLDDTSCLSAETLSSAIIYNMALVLHLKGIRTNSAVLLKKALDLYKMSTRLQEHDLSLVPGGTSTTLALSRSLMIACCNNMGQLAYLRFDQEQVQTMKGALLSLLTTPSSSSPPMVVEQHQLAQACFSLVLFDAEDMESFKTNLIFMNPPMTAPVA